MLHKLFRRGMSCADVLEVLQSYVDGEIDDAEARQVLAHLDGCDPCDHESVVYRRIKVSLRKRATPIDPEIMSALTQFSNRVARGEVR